MVGGGGGKASVFLHVEQLIVTQIEPSSIPCFETLWRSLEQIAFELIDVGGIDVRTNGARESILGKLTNTCVTVLHGLFQLTRFQSHCVYLFGANGHYVSFCDSFQVNLIKLIGFWFPVTHIIANATKEFLVIGAQIRSLMVERIACLIVVQQLNAQNGARRAAATATANRGIKQKHNISREQ